MSYLRDPVLPRKRGHAYCGLCVERTKRVRQQPAVAFVAAIPLCQKHWRIVAQIAQEARLGSVLPRRLLDRAAEEGT